MADHDAPPADAIRYDYRSSIRGGSWRFELTDEGVSWQAGRRHGVMPYANIAQIRLSYRPVSMQRHRFRMDVRGTDRMKLRVASATWIGLVATERQDEAYRAFVLGLHRRLSARTRCLGGLTTLAYWLGGAAIALVGAALGGLFVRAVAEGSWQGAVFMAAFAALFGWQIGGFLWRNRPMVYTPDKVPAHLLP